MKHSKRHSASVILGASLVVAVAVGGSGLQGAGMKEGKGGAKYAVTFLPTWNPATHPLEYPFAHAKKGLLTPIIGATHNGGYQIFGEGRRPSPGLERLSEMGKHDPLDAEIRAAIEAGKAGAIIEVDIGSEGPVHPPVSFEVGLTPENPQVSLVGMIAPSPDWFYGVSGVQLYERGRWVPQATVTAYAWDSGGDSGSTYLAEDQDLNPKAPTGYADSAHFHQGSERVPVGVFVFTLVPDTEG